MSDLCSLEPTPAPVGVERCGAFDNWRSSLRNKRSFCEREKGHPVDEWTTCAAACKDCRGRGWYVGECHPQEKCGSCNGTGRTTADTTGKP